MAGELLILLLMMNLELCSYEILEIGTASDDVLHYSKNFTFEVH